MNANLTLPDGVSLAYLRNFWGGDWECLVRRRLECDAHTIRYAVGFGADRSNPDTAITLALDALDRDPQLVSEALSIPTCAPPSFDLAALAALLTPSSISPSKPLFKLKSSGSP